MNVRMTSYAPSWVVRVLTQRLIYVSQTPVYNATSLAMVPLLRTANSLLFTAISNSNGD